MRNKLRSMLYRGLAVVLGILMAVPFGQLEAKAAAAMSQSDAVTWAKSQINKTLDYDGVYGAQCVDLIAYYYRALGTTTPGGNANAYLSNSLPSGWKRLQGSYQPGDIAVWPVNHSYANETVSEYSLRRAVENIGIVEIERAIERKLLRTEQQKPKKIDLLKEYKEIEGVYSRKRKSKNIANYVGEVHWICRSCKQINGSDQTCLSCHKANVKWRKSKA